MRGLADWSTKRIFDVVAEENQPYVGRMLSEIAAEQGRDPFDVLCDIAVADDLLTSFGPDAPCSSAEDWKLRVDVWRDSRAVIGASDAGAHLDLLATFNYSTVLLARSRPRARRAPAGGGRAPHHRRAGPALRPRRPGPARGRRPRRHRRVRPGDGRQRPDRHALRPPRWRRPACTPTPQGIDHVVVNGTPLVVDGALTADRPGRVLRSGRDTRTPEMA